MINSAEAKKMIASNLDKIKESEEFKFALSKIESDIFFEVKRGNNSFSYNKCALVKDHASSSPSRAVLNALKDECKKHGYLFEEYQCLSRNGNYNSCYKVSW